MVISREHSLHVLAGLVPLVYSLPSSQEGVLLVLARLLARAKATRSNTMTARAEAKPPQEAHDLLHSAAVTGDANGLQRALKRWPLDVRQVAVANLTRTRTLALTIAPILTLALTLSRWPWRTPSSSTSRAASPAGPTGSPPRPSSRRRRAATPRACTALS